MTMADLAAWGICGLATAGVTLRLLRVPQWAWALGGALILVLCGLLPMGAALAGVAKGGDVYLFLAGMMLLAELARQEGLFDWLAAQAANRARGSPQRLFGLVYLVGILVTVFLSNDATAVVLTPAVAAVARAAKVARPLPYLLVCAFIANAASFVLPISNPANLVIYAERMPRLLEWLPRFALPSVLAIGLTFVLLRHTQREALRGPVASHVPVPDLPPAGVLTAWGIGATAVVLMAASALGLRLGAPTCAAGVLALFVVSWRAGSSPWRFCREVDWGVLPLVAGLFVLVEALERSGVVRLLAGWLQTGVHRSAPLAAAGAGLAVGFGANLINNLPAGLIAGSAVHGTVMPTRVTSALLVGVDLGPNLSVTGSLATILWLGALRREGLDVGPGDFLRLGLRIMPLTLVAALAAVVAFAG